MLRYHLLETPTGPFALLETNGPDLHSTWVKDARDPQLRDRRHDRAFATGTARRVTAWFAGDIDAFDDITTPDGPPFHRACWEACRQITRGTVIGYGELARRAGSPAAARAAGQAMRNNPLPIIVPCHRVTRAGGGLGGFSGSIDPTAAPLQRKRWLLTMEGAPCQVDTPLVPEVIGRLLSNKNLKSPIFF